MCFSGTITWCVCPSYGLIGKCTQAVHCHMIIARMCMKISKRPGEEFKIFLDGKQLSQEKYFNYHGSLITQDGSCEKEMAIIEVELWSWIEYYVNYWKPWMKVRAKPGYTCYTGQNVLLTYMQAVDSQFPLLPSPNSPIIRARRQRKLRINLG